MKQRTETSYQERILRVLVFIQEHLDEAMNLEELARVAHFSPYHFHRIFRGMVGESVMEHVRRLRLERAAQRLLRTQQPVTRIAFDSGYETHEAFTRAFRAMFGESPSGFREANKPASPRQVDSQVHFVPQGNLEDFEPFKTGGPTMEVRIENIEPMRVAFVRHVGPYPEVGTAWQKLMGWAGALGLFGPNLKLLGLVHDDPEVTASDKVRYDACMPVGDEVKAEGEIGIQTIAAGDYAVATHRGPYEMLGNMYARLCGEWLPDSGRELRSAPGFEIYHNSPQNTPPDDLLTDVYLPLEPSE